LRMPEESQRLRVVIDSDTANEIDDQFAIAWALLSPDRLQIEAVHAAPFSHGRYFQALAEASKSRGHVASEFERIAVAMPAEKLEVLIDLTPPADGMERSYAEIGRVFEASGIEPGDRIRRGSTDFLSSIDVPLESEATESLIKLAHSANPRDPIYVATIGAPTNVASALLLDPSIAANLRVLFLAGFPSGAGLDDDSFNLVQDRLASNVLFESDVPLVYIPGYQVAETLQLSLPAAKEWLSDGGRLSQYLLQTYKNNPYNPQLEVPGRSWVIWDIIVIAWLLNEDWVPARNVPRARITSAHRWDRLPPSAGQMSEPYCVKRNEVFEDFFRKLSTRTD
jgi:purine nucleosidase